MKRRKHKKRLVCKAGHHLAGGNVRIMPNGWQKCLACWRVHLRKRRERYRLCKLEERIMELWPAYLAIKERRP